MPSLLSVMRDRGQWLLVSASCMVCRIMASGDDGSFGARGAREDEERDDGGFGGVLIEEWEGSFCCLRSGCRSSIRMGRVTKPIGDGRLVFRRSFGGTACISPGMALGD